MQNQHNIRHCFLNIFVRRSTNTTSCATLTWLGVQSISNTSWAWIDGSLLKFSFWDYTEPTTDNNCTTQLYQGGRWQTRFPCDNIRVTVCQMRLSIALLDLAVLSIIDMPKLWFLETNFESTTIPALVINPVPRKEGTHRHFRARGSV